MGFDLRGIESMVFFIEKILVLVGEAKEGSSSL